jgi:hypothetical protein
MPAARVVGRTEDPDDFTEHPAVGPEPTAAPQRFPDRRTC